MTIVDINGNTYDTDDLIVDRGYLTMFPAMLNDVAAVAVDVAADATAAADSATAAANVVANAMKTTSTTSKSLGSISVGVNQTFTTVDNLDTVAAFVDQMWIKAVSASDSTKYLIGTVYSATGTTLIITPSSVTGSGTVSDWSIFATGAPGASGTLDIAGLSVVTIDPATDHIPFRDVSGSTNAKNTPDAIVQAATLVEHDTCKINNTLSTTDYVIGYFDFTCTLTNVEMIASAGTGTIVLYLSSDTTSASGTAITGGSVSVSTTKATGSLTANNTVTSGTSKYLIAKCTASSSLANVVVALKLTKTGGA